MPQQLSKRAMNFAATSGKRALKGPVATVFMAANTGSWRLERPVINSEECIYCGTCQKFCPTDVITVTKAEDDSSVVIDFDYCKGCGICANRCPKKCITMVPEEGVCKS